MSAFFCFVPTLLVAVALGHVSEEKSREVTVEGKIVCTDSPNSELSGGSDCEEPSRIALETDDYRRFYFLDHDSRAQIFKDTRVRERRLRITGWRRRRDHLEIITLQSVRDGLLYDLYYRCEVCNITALVGGPCPCCQDELEFRETPSKE